MNSRLARALPWVAGIVESEAEVMLSILALLALALEAAKSTGIWQLDWFRSNTDELILSLLALIAILLPVQLRRHEKQLKVLNATLAVKSDLAEKCHKLGISGVWVEDRESVDKWRGLLRKARTLSVLSVTGYSWACDNEDVLSDLVLKTGCQIQVLLATPRSDFVNLREHREGEA